jgi:hypothetical protein
MKEARIEMECQRDQVISQLESPPDDRCIVWFDIDNTIYPSNSGVAEAMIERIQGMSYCRV